MKMLPQAFQQLIIPKAPDEADYTAWAYSEDGKDRFTTIYPKLNLLDGTTDFSGDWKNLKYWETDGMYKGVIDKQRTEKWFPIYKAFTAPKDGVYAFSAYIKSTGNSAGIARYVDKNGSLYWSDGAHKVFENNFDWLRDSFTVSLKANDTIFVRYEMTGSASDSILWTAGHKWEEGSTATPYMPSESEVIKRDYPSYIGNYTGKIGDGQSTDPVKYNWKKID